LECIFLIPRALLVKGEVTLLSVVADGVFFWLKDAAMATGSPSEDRRGEKRVRRKAEANSLAASVRFERFVRIEEYWKELWWCFVYVGKDR
jgi:hypothetical protein